MFLSLRPEGAQVLGLALPQGWRPNLYTTAACFSSTVPQVIYEIRPLAIQGYRLWKKKKYLQYFLTYEISSVLELIFEYGLAVCWQTWQVNTKFLCLMVDLFYEATPI